MLILYVKPPGADTPTRHPGHDTSLEDPNEATDRDLDERVSSS